METAELDVALEELETRLERLRSLYEQYFMGIEKIEPQIARKDVDRRIYVLRREKIRNTAKRFKLQTIIQRYNTFQQYWMRICREIENGTYKRHLLRAQKQNGELLTIAARKRLGRQARTSQPPEGATPSKPPSGPPSAPPSTPALAAAPATPPPSAELAAAVASAVPGPLGSPPIPRRPPLPGRAPEAAAASPPKPALPKFESLDLDMDFMGDWDPGANRTAPRPATPAAKPAATAPVAPAPALRPAPGPAAARPASIPPAPVAAPPRPASSRPPTAPARPAAPRIPASPRIPPAPPKRLPTAASPRPIPAAVAPKLIATAAAPPPRPAAAAAPPPKPAAAAAPPPKPAAPAPPKPAPVASPNVDDARLRDLHARLQQAKQQTKEANVSFEGLAKSIRATEAKLREQHKNRKIDFDVVIKDGKAVVKPIVR